MKKQTKKEIVSYVLSTLFLYGFSLVFSLLSLIFIADKIPKWVQFVVSFVFIAPILYIAYVQGRTQGEKLFKARAKTSLTDLHAEQAICLPYHKCVWHVIGFCVPLVLCTVFAVALKNTVFRLIVLAFEFPVALMFYSVGVIDIAVASPIMFAIFVPYALIVAGIFVLGYLLTLYRLKRRQADIESEIRMFDN